ncbi:membrane protein [Clostridiisalibacter paucivorans]|uniref:membrane protein n=1 Tax=Clostridiisalibacter paucivorans TaxID=408753 RepID=UPI000479DA88|nr:membrane protein [Clostridiisalibacter paucivorans]
MNSLYALTTVLIIYAIGDFVSAKTKAIFSMLFVSSAIFLIGFWNGLPLTIFEDAALLKIGAILIALLITHMGTLMNIGQLKAQWKTVIIALGAVVGIGVFLFLVGSPILGKEYAVTAAPPISGGVVAALIMGEAAKAKGLETIVVFTTLLVVVQGFLGYPIASICLNKESNRIKMLYKDGKLETDNGDNNIESRPKYRIIPPLPENLQTTFIYLAKLSIVAVIGFKLAELTNGIVNKYVMCLIVGIISREIGLLEENIMTKANGFGLGMVALMAVIFANLTKATPQMVLDLLWPLIGSLLLGSVGIALTSLILGKVLGYTKEMAIAIGISSLFGFPGTFIISNEVANAVGETDEERKIILNQILPKMLVAGFITVTIASVVLAGVMSKMI